MKTTKSKKEPRKYPTITKFYKDLKNEWRWRIKTGKNIVSASTQGYNNFGECKGNYFDNLLKMTIVCIPEFNEQPEHIAGLRNNFVNDKTKTYKVYL